MANAHHEDRSSQTAEETIRRTSEKAAERAGRISQSAAEASGTIAKSGADLFQQNVETLQSAWRFGLDMANALSGRSAQQFNRTFGFSGDEAQQATQRSARNTDAVLQSTSAATQGMSQISREYFDFVRHQFENSMDRMNEFWRCRTPQQVMAVQSDFLRNTVETAMESSRRVAGMSVKVAEDTARQIERTQRAA